MLVIGGDCKLHLLLLTHDQLLLVVEAKLVRHLYVGAEVG